MGGCYRSSLYSSSCEEQGIEERSVQNLEVLLKKFQKNHELNDLIAAYKSFFNNTKNKNGFFIKLAKVLGINNIEEIPKEFPEVEYEVKFNVASYGKGKEPTIEDYLNAIDFPVGANARFLKDPVNNIATGINSFIGDDLDERLVIIEKGGNLYLKEKGEVNPTNTGVLYEDIVLKRDEARYQSSIGEIITMLEDISKNKNFSYKGKIRKEKGDAFILDTSDGRIYSMSFTRAHLIKAGEKKESGIQRQLELEYAGYMPKFNGLEKDSEKQIVQGLVDLAKYIFIMYNEAPITNGWRMNLKISNERKYDFINKDKERIDEKPQLPFNFTLMGRENAGLSR